ncbi:hypothetical protein CRE_01090 [Caenorhabditis remanei]|uniref:Homeobox-cysteine loop-homeobox domain-containing protein n=1 Tax=Caenorhabditis remanei TaxID=31234 RepID=E3MIE6_CAERE|nr:hypothetical protein CRE_01090 [Caenorhabditis remanei]
MELALVKYIPRSSYYEFDRDQEFYDRNPHPSIEEMICISKETSIDYSQIFKRFSELRLKNGETCSKNDTCIKVFKYFNCDDTFNGTINKRLLRMMNDEFEFVGRREKLPIENLHLLMQATRLPEKTIVEEYTKWRQKEDFEIGLTTGMKQHLYSVFQNNPFMNSERLKRLADNTRLDAEQMQAFFDSWSCKRQLKKHNSVPSKKFAWMDDSFDDDDNESSDPVDILPLHLDVAPKMEDANQNEVSRSESRISEEESQEADEKLLNLLDSSLNQFPMDLEYFERNRHPSIQTMINISIEVDVPYETVIKRYFELRMVVRERCKRNDTCRKIFQFLEEEEDVLLDERNKKLLEKEFSGIKYADRYQVVGQFHLIMDKICLPLHFVHRKYKEWFEMRKVRKQINRVNIKRYWTSSQLIFSETTTSIFEIKVQKVYDTFKRKVD